MPDLIDHSKIKLHCDKNNKDDKNNENNVSKVTIDTLLNESRLSQVNNSDGTTETFATSGQKWWAAIILGFVFAFVSSIFFYSITNGIATSLGGLPTMCGGPTLIGLILHTVIFILVVRLILW
jgi:hypothetical protein